MKVEVVPIFDKGYKDFVSKKSQKPFTISQYLAHEPDNKNNWFDLVFIGASRVSLTTGKPVSVDMMSFTTDPNTKVRTLKCFVPTDDKK